MKREEGEEKKKEAEGKGFVVSNSQAIKERKKRKGESFWEKERVSTFEVKRVFAFKRELGPIEGCQCINCKAEGEKRRKTVPLLQFQIRENQDAWPMKWSNGRYWTNFEGTIRRWVCQKMYIIQLLSKMER